MNKNIKRLAEEAGMYFDKCGYAQSAIGGTGCSVQTYSKLLIEECLEVIYNIDRENFSFEEISEEVKTHFGLN